MMLLTLGTYIGVVKGRVRYYWVKRIPKRFKGLVVGSDNEAVSQVRQALHTDNKTEAHAKATQIEAARLAEWEAVASGNGASARAHFEAARKLAEARGLKYITPDKLLAGPFDEIWVRVRALETRSDGLERPEVARACPSGAA